MLVTKEPIRREIPHEPGEWMDFCKLSWRQMRDARKRQEKDNIATVKEFGAEFIQALNSDGGEKKAKKLLQEQQYDPRAFDQETLLSEGIVAWSYQMELDLTSVAQLDEVTADWAMREIIAINRPMSEEEEKKDSVISTVSSTAIQPTET